MNILRNRILFKLLTKEDKRRLIRIALHRRDPYHALEDQKEMILQLKDQGYEILKYRDLIPRLQMLLGIFLLFMAALLVVIPLFVNGTYRDYNKGSLDLINRPLEHFYGYPKRQLTELGNLTMYPDAEEKIKIGVFKNVLSSLYEHVRTCKICHTYLNAILENLVKSKEQQLPTLMSFGRAFFPSLIIRHSITKSSN